VTTSEGLDPGADAPVKSEALERGKDTFQHPARKTRQDAEQGRGWYAWLARAGLVAKGVSYGIVGVLALELAFGEGGKATSRSGALATIADESAGKVLLVLLVLGFAAYAIWRFVQAFAEREDDASKAKGEAKKWGKRAGYIGRGVIYAALAVTTVRLLTNSGGGGSQNQQARETTATVLEWPGGRWLVGLGGIAIAGAGAWNIYRGLAKKFEDRWRTGEMSRPERTWGGRAGVAGHLARGVVFALIGIFITKAAIEYDPSDAIGLDGALQKLASTTYGPYLLGLTALGLICYGLYCLVDARYRDVSANARS
jgi:Na+-transporting methylmalonyl-CoA/oxaloacetate decarboxylase gamma subunit